MLSQIRALRGEHGVDEAGAVDGKREKSDGMDEGGSMEESGQRGAASLKWGQGRRILLLIDGLDFLLAASGGGSEGLGGGDSSVTEVLRMIAVFREVSFSLSLASSQHTVHPSLRCHFGHTGATLSKPSPQALSPS